MQPEKKIVIFLSEFDYQLKQINKIYADLRKKLEIVEKQEPSKELVESIGYWLHNLYCAFEDLFKIVSGFWENSIRVNGDFHIHLLKKMRIDIKDVRPALLTEKSHAYLDELRGFRHVFRHAYSYGLDDERVLFLLRKTIGAKDSVLRDIGKFRSKIEKMI